MIQIDQTHTQIAQIEVVSVPHSGTHFAMHCVQEFSFGESVIRQRHIDVNSASAVIPRLQHDGGLIVVPIRHPIRVLMSHYTRNDHMRQLAPYAYVSHVAGYFALLGLFVCTAREHGCTVIEIPVDGSTADRALQLGNLAKAVYGYSFDQEVQLAGQLAIRYMAILKEWPIKGWKKWKEVPDFGSLSPLQQYADYFGYPEVNPGELKQFMGAPESEAQKHVAWAGKSADALSPKVIMKGEARVIKRQDPEHPLNRAAAG